MRTIYKSEEGKQAVLGAYKSILAAGSAYPDKY
jgi:hypothetical protein